MTKTDGAIYVGGFCRHCGKPFPAGSTKRRKFCDDRCRQAGYRDRTGKADRAGTLRQKKPIPIAAKMGLRKAEPFSHAEFELLARGMRNYYLGNSGVIEVYHHRYGRGILDLYRPIADCNGHWLEPDGRGGMKQRSALFQTLAGPPPKNPAVWRQARCLFTRPKIWRYLNWSDVYLLNWHGRDCHCDLPKRLRWIHLDATKRVRRFREVHIDFARLCEREIIPESYGDKFAAGAALTQILEDNNDDTTQTMPLENYDSTDAHGSDGQD